VKKVVGKWEKYTFFIGSHLADVFPIFGCFNVLHINSIADMVCITDGCISIILTIIIIVLFLTLQLCYHSLYNLFVLSAIKH